MHYAFTHCKMSRICAISPRDIYTDMPGTKRTDYISEHSQKLLAGVTLQDVLEFTPLG